jgi:hypothetical protein
MPLAISRVDKANGAILAIKNLEEEASYGVKETENIIGSFRTSLKIETRAGCRHNCKSGRVNKLNPGCQGNNCKSIRMIAR